MNTRTLEQIAEEAAGSLNAAFNLYAWDDSKAEAKAIVLAALQEAVAASSKISAG